MVSLYLAVSCSKTPVEEAEESNQIMQLLSSQHQDQKMYPSNEFSQNLQAAALFVTQKISKPYQQVQALSVIAKNYAYFNQQEAENVLSQALDIARSIAESAAKAEEIGRLAVTYADIQAFIAAEELLTQASEIASPLAQAAKENNTATEIEHRYFEVAVRLAEAGEYSRALHLSDRIQIPLRETLREIIGEQAEEKVQLPSGPPHIDLPDENLPSSDPDLSSSSQGTNLGQMLDTAEQYALAGQREQAVALAEQILQTQRDLQLQQAPDEIYLPFSEAYVMSGIATIFAMVGQPERALQLLQEDRPNNLIYKASALITVGEAFAEQDRHEKATELFNRLLDLAQGASNAEDKVDILTQLASSYTNSGNKKQASQILEQAVQEFSNIDCGQQGYIAFLFYEAENYDRALEVAKLSCDEGIFDTLMDLVAVYSEAGNFDKAFEVVEVFKTANEKALALADIAVSYAESGKADKGFEVMVQAIQIVQDDEDPGTTIGSILSQYLETEQTRQVLDLLKSIEDETTLSTALAELSNNLESESIVLEILSQIEAAAVIADSMRGQELATIAQQYAQIEHYEKALSIAARIEDPVAQSQVFSNLARIYLETGHQVNVQIKNRLQTILDNLD